MRTALIEAILQFTPKPRLGRLTGVRSAVVTGSIALTVTLGLWIGPVQAFEQCGEPQFGIAGIEVDQSAETAEQAQIIGARQAAEIAFERVLVRLLRDEAPVAAFIADNPPDNFIDFFRIDEEKSIAGRYIARLDYCFDAARLRKAFREAGHAWAELRSPVILVMPVWLAPDGARAWQQDNPWLAGWREAVANSDGLVRVTLLQPTILNERSLRAEDLAMADPDTLRRAATVAGADQIMLVTARLDYKGSTQVLAVDGQLFSDNAEQLTVLGQMIDRPVSGDLKPQLDFARSSILAELEGGWHAANVMSGDETRSVTVRVPVSSLAEWAARLEAFESLAVIDSYVVHALNIRGGLVTLNLVGEEAAMSNGLSAYGLRLSQRDDGSNIIEPR